MIHRAYSNTQSHLDRLKDGGPNAAHLTWEELEPRTEHFSKWKTAQMVNANEEFQLALNIA